MAGASWSSSLTSMMSFEVNDVLERDRVGTDYRVRGATKRGDALKDGCVEAKQLKHVGSGGSVQLFAFDRDLDHR